MTFPKLKKSLGQNFLKDEFYISKIIESFNLKPDDTVLEIGPGGGALTKRITGRVKKLYAVEIDQRLIDNLEDKISDDDFVLFNEDFLKFDLVENIQEENIKIVGNLPYHVTSPIIFKVMELASEVNNDKLKIQSLTIMIQKEVAERIVAKVNTKAYGVISVFTRFFCEPEILFDIPPEAFFPKPKITSSIIRFNFTTGNGNLQKVKDMKHFRSVVKTTFLNRRKMLRNTLKAFIDDPGLITTVEVTKRPENLSVADFISLSNEIYLL
ncbi:MAG TPA: 16S rRNA (adenine(1518)-N(6)/adenine(1519)-N(6))-dimethyltransferase RsmA [Clostridiales bacterium]|jgi:16S rRNA (adenine1518-N6/adenine1519-N6)-dimethyltransferase|nr:16S rRNA (adenine(1518)-N(6)/adenine(1519)-N(6))-dimethyltransferase RsmA [Clostridiales bacterium]HQP70962.1 16S rRNA (adenine(1518)-N(6)/adenine(1519)-N(6))-dimethyltransferase RsmA [Clostridiales bacterium]